MIKAIIFDMGGVMLQNKVEAVYQKLAEILNISFDELKELQKQHKTEMLSGKMSSQEFAEIIKNNFGLEINVLEKWKEAYYQVMPVNNELIELVDKLKNNYKVAIISNVPELHAQINKDRGLFSHFELALISCDIGLIKPQKEIFALVLERLNLKASDCIFIDDREEHLAMPKEIGFQVIHFKDNQQLKNDLKSLGIIKGNRK